MNTINPSSANTAMLPNTMTKPLRMKPIIVGEPTNPATVYVTRRSAQ